MPIRRLLLLTFLLLAFALRVYSLDTQSLWWDEGISLHLATSAIPEIFADRLNNIHPPLYFVALKGWVNLVGVGAFNGRYLSVLASLLQIPILYAFGRRWFKGRPWATETAVLLLTLSPIAIIYAQEIRVYSLLPAVYLALLIVAFRIRQQPATWTPWLLFGFLEWLAIHLHYVAIFALVFINAWLVWSLLANNRWRRWLSVNLVAGAAAMPWLGAVLLNWSAVREHAELGTYTTEATPLPFLLSQVWGFHLTGLATAFATPLVFRGLIAIALLTAVLLAATLWDRDTRQTAVFLLVAWLLPVAAAFSFWSVRSFSHPRYVIMYAVLLLPLTAFLAMPTSRPMLPIFRSLAGWGGMLLVGLMLVLSLWGTGRYFFDDTIAKDDVRGVATYLEQVAQPDDLIIIPDTDWSLPFEYEGAAPVMMADVAQRDQMWANLAQWTQAGQHVYLFDYEQGTYDFQQIIPYALERAGTLEHIEHIDDLLVRRYFLDEAVAPPQLMSRQLENGRFAPLAYQALSVNEATTSSAVTLAIQWQVNEPMTQRLRVALRLQEKAGFVRGTADMPLLNKNGRPTEQWVPGDTVTTYHLIPIQPQTPPLTLDLYLSLYELTESGVQPLELLDTQGAPQGQQLWLTAIDPAFAAGLPNPYELPPLLAPWPEPQMISSGLLLQGASIETEKVAPGQTINVFLLWQEEGAVGEELPQLRLEQDGDVLVEETAVYPQHPPSEWPPNASFGVVRRVRIPTTVQGDAALVVQLGEERYELGVVQVEPSDHLFSEPQPAYPLNIVFGDVARLIGYDLPDSRFGNDAVVPLTLYWESLVENNTVDYTVFAHILSEDGRLIGQHDAPPANGRRPTTGWVKGEFVVDPHEMVFREAGYVGTAIVEVGLYDPLTNGRLTTSQGQDFIYLPINLSIEPSQ